MADYTRTWGEMITPNYSYEPSNVIEPSSWYEDNSYAGYDADYDSPYHRHVRRVEELRSFPKWLKFRVARALPRYITELSDQEWDAIVWNCSSMPPPTDQFQPTSPPYPIQEPSPYQSYYSPPADPPYQEWYQDPLHQPSFQEPYQQFNLYEEVHPAQEESSMPLEVSNLMQELQAGVAELKRSLLAIEHNAILVAEEVLPAEAINQYPGQMVYVEEESSEEETEADIKIAYKEPPSKEEAHSSCVTPDVAKVFVDTTPEDHSRDEEAECCELYEDITLTRSPYTNLEDNSFHTTSLIPAPPAQRSALDPHYAEWLISAFDHLHSDLPDEEFEYEYQRPELTEACDNGEPVEFVSEQLEDGQVMVSEASDDEDSNAEIVYEEPMPKEEVHIPCIIPSMAEVLSEPKDPMSDLFAEFPEFRELDSQSGFPCTDCAGNSLCSTCAEIEEAIRGKPIDLSVSVACPTQLHCEHSELEVGEANTSSDQGSTVEGTHSTKAVLKVDIPKGGKLTDHRLLPITYHFSSLVPSLPLLTWRMPSIDPLPPQHVSFLGRHEYAYLENDAQLQDLCVTGTEDLIEANEERAYKKPLCGSSRSFSLRVNGLWNVKTKRRQKDLRHTWKFPRHGSQKLHGFKDHDMIYIEWDPDGERPSKPWWELQDQFKHKPP